MLHIWRWPRNASATSSSRFAKVDKNGQRRGGARRWRRSQAEGRHRSDAKRGEPHKPRPEVKARFPRHVVLRVAPVIGSLRKRHLYAALRVATIAVAMRELAYDEVNGAFRIIHISIQKTHIHMIVEADNKLAMSRGMQSFMISAAKHINRAYSEKLELATASTRPRVRRSLSPGNHRDAAPSSSRAFIRAEQLAQASRRPRAGTQRPGMSIPFSTGCNFMGWRSVRRGRALARPRDLRSARRLLPKTWLLRKGWRKAGTISFYEVPSARR